MESASQKWRIHLQTSFARKRSSENEAIRIWRVCDLHIPRIPIEVAMSGGLDCVLGHDAKTMFSDCGNNAGGLGDSELGHYV